MLCPNCKRKMKHETGTDYDLDFSGTAEDYELEFTWHKYSCNICHIEYDGRTWTIPPDLQPSEKQKKTILFINNRLLTDFEALTKRQCWEIINKNFETEKNQQPYYDDSFIETMSAMESEFF